MSVARPGDTWDLYVGKDNRVEQFVYHRGGPKKAERRHRNVGELQESRPSPYLDRAHRYGGRRASPAFLFGCGCQAGGLGYLGERAIEEGRLFGQLISFLRISLRATTTSATGILDCHLVNATRGWVHLRGFTRAEPALTLPEPMPV